MTRTDGLIKATEMDLARAKEQLEKAQDIGYTNALGAIKERIADLNEILTRLQRSDDDDTE